MTHELLTLSAAELARRIQSHAVRVREVIDAHLARIEAVNPAINAVITPDFETARQTAASADEHITQYGADDLPPLFGVPVTIKDCWPVRGLRFTAGTWQMRDQIADEDAAAVRKLREAGAIILGKTNCPDLSWMFETTNPIFGRTNNPRALDRSVGGSSGGEAAIIAAGGSPLGLGSDIAGSVRVPAACTGIVSLKPTPGRIPTDGHIPQVRGPIAPFNTAGPMARRVEDLALALRVLSETPVRDYQTISLSGRTLIPYTTPFAQHPVISAVMQAADALERAGMRRRAGIRFPVFETLFSYAAMVGKYGYGDVRRILGGGTPYRLWDEIAAIQQGEVRISPQLLFFFALSAPSLRLAEAVGFGERWLEQARREWLALMGDDGVIVVNVLMTGVPYHGWGYTTPFLPPMTPLHNALGLPSAVVPVAWDVHDLPLAVQVVARPGEDEVVLAAAAALEQAFGGWQIAAG